MYHFPNLQISALYSHQRGIHLTYDLYTLTGYHVYCPSFNVETSHTEEKKSGIWVNPPLHWSVHITDKICRIWQCETFFFSLLLLERRHFLIFLKHCCEIYCKNKVFLNSKTIRFKNQSLNENVFIRINGCHVTSCLLSFRKFRRVPKWY